MGEERKQEGLGFLANDNNCGREVVIKVFLLVGGRLSVISNVMFVLMLFVEEKGLLVQTRTEDQVAAVGVHGGPVVARRPEFERIEFELHCGIYFGLDEVGVGRVGCQEGDGSFLGHGDADD